MQDCLSQTQGVGYRSWQIHRFSADKMEVEADGGFQHPDLESNFQLFDPALSKTIFQS